MDSPNSLRELSISAYIVGLQNGNLPQDAHIFDQFPLSLTAAILVKKSMLDEPALIAYAIEILSTDNRFLRMCNRAELHPLLEYTLSSLIIDDENTINTLHATFTNVLRASKRKFLLNDPATGDQKFDDYINQGIRFSAFLLDAFWVQEALSFISSVRDEMDGIPYGNSFQLLLLWLRVLLQLLTTQNAHMRLVEAYETARKIKRTLSEFDSRSGEGFAEIPASLYAELYQQMLLTYVKLDIMEASDVQYANVLRVLDDTLPPQIVVDCLRTVAKYCIAKGKNQAGHLMFSQAIKLAEQIFERRSKKYVVLLLDYADSLMNVRLTMVALSVYILAEDIVDAGAGGRLGELKGLIMMKEAYSWQVSGDCNPAYLQSFCFEFVSRTQWELFPYDWTTGRLNELFHMTDEHWDEERTADLKVLIDHLKALTVGDFCNQVPEDVIRVLSMMSMYPDASVKRLYILPTVLRLEKECSNQQQVKGLLNDYGLLEVPIYCDDQVLLFNDFLVPSSLIPVGELKRQLSEAGLVLREEDALDELLWHISVLEDVPAELEDSSRRNPDMPPLRLPYRFGL